MRHRRGRRPFRHNPSKLICQSEKKKTSKILLGATKTVTGRVTYLGIELLPHAPSTRALHDPHNHIRDQAQHKHPNALIARRNDLRHRAHAHDARPRRRQQRRLPARLVRRPAHPRVRALRQRSPRQAQLMPGAERREAQRARVRVRERDEARGAGSGDRPAERIEPGQERERDVVVDDDDCGGIG